MKKYVPLGKRTKKEQKKVHAERRACVNAKACTQVHKTEKHKIREREKETWKPIAKEYERASR